MPPKGGRKKPFSAKQKKEQLKAKRERKRAEEKDEDGRTVRPGKSKFYKYSEDDGHSSDESTASETSQNVKRMNQQPSGKTDKGYDPNRYRLHFQKETQHEIEKRKKQAMKPLEMLPETALEIDLDEIYKPGSVLDMPKRPPWDYKMSKMKLDSREELYFREYLENVMEKFSSEELSYFELNLETWRQLWRVLEIADVVLLITDIRHPALHFSPALYDYVTKELGKGLILVLNKIDLVLPSVVAAWKQYFSKRFPEISVVCFTSFPKNTQELDTMTKEPSKLDLSCWQQKIEEDTMSIESDENVQLQSEDLVLDTSFQKHESFKDGVLSIGCCGHPNVGKSSIINGLMGKKVVSVSKTPGHTKHFQTIFLTSNVKLCDSPGLVFPSLVAKPMQILSGIYPIAQVREPYTTVGFLAQRIPLQKILRINHPSLEDEDVKTEDLKWSAYDVCIAWADKRGFLTARAGRPDVYRAANNLLRLAVEGRVIMCMTPPGFTNDKGYWESHPDTHEIALQQESHRKSTRGSDSDEDEIALTESDLDEREHLAGQEGDGETETEDSQSETENIEGLANRNPFSLLNEDV